jgi:hypothetical protein
MPVPAATEYWIGARSWVSASNKQERSAHPEGEKELYPSWQGKQYLHSMFSVQNQSLDNDYLR